MIIKTGLIPKVAFTFCGREIYWYAILIVSAMIIGFIFAKINDGKFNIKFDYILNLCIFMLPISILTARAYYVLFNLKYYIANPTEILNFRNGGLAIYGGIFGAILTIIIYCKIKKIKILDLTDFLAPVLPLGQAIGRWGNYINIEAYGNVTNWPIKMKIIENGITKYVHPTFLYESIGDFILFLILLKIYYEKKSKQKMLISDENYENCKSANYNNLGEKSLKNYKECFNKNKNDLKNDKNKANNNVESKFSRNKFNENETNFIANNVKTNKKLYKKINRKSDSRKFSGQITFIYFIGYSFIRFFIESLRTDSLMLGNIRISQLVSLVLFVVFVIFYIIKSILKTYNNRLK